MRKQLCTPAAEALNLKRFPQRVDVGFGVAGSLYPRLTVRDVGLGAVEEFIYIARVQLPRPA